MKNWILFPPFVFVILLAAVFVLSYLSDKLSPGESTVDSGKCKPYACGEDMPAPQISPDYTKFFQFALFFTVMHVVALVLLTVPKRMPGAYGIASVYLLGALVGLLILFRE